MAYVYLAIAILGEVSATVALRMAARGQRSWYAVVAMGYIAAFALLTLTLANGVGLGVAYGIWAAAGVALTAILSKVAFSEPLNRTMAGGIALIVVGVLLIEVGSAH